MFFLHLILNSTTIFASLLAPVYGKSQNDDINIDMELPSAMSITNANSNNAAHTNISASIHTNLNFSDREKDFISEGSSNGYIREGYISDIGSISSEESAGTKKKRKGSLVKRIIENEEYVCISLELEHGGDECGVTQLSAVLFMLGGFETSDIDK